MLKLLRVFEIGCNGSGMAVKLRLSCQGLRVRMPVSVLEIWGLYLYLYISRFSC
jgi:hypothetical protein